ncbi:MAG: signal peptidase I, partial [Dehalococcoidia bacterium]
HNGQYLIVNKLAYATIDTGIFDWVPFYNAGEDSVHHIFGAPGRGDVVVFQAPNDQQKDFIKRIIGVPGDHVEVSQGDVILNGEVLEEPYVDGDTTCPADCVLDVPKKNYFVMGDNRANSSDSRTFGPIPEDNIIGKAFISYWPLDDAGWAPNQSISYARDSAGTEE